MLRGDRTVGRVYNLRAPLTCPLGVLGGRRLHGASWDVSISLEWLQRVSLGSCGLRQGEQGVLSDVSIGNVQTCEKFGVFI